MCGKGRAEEPEEEVGALRPPWLGDAARWRGIMSLVGCRMGCRSWHLVFLPWMILQPLACTLCFSLRSESPQGILFQPCLS